jgi:hypothetical protein
MKLKMTQQLQAILNGFGIALFSKLSVLLAPSDAEYFPDPFP